MKYASLRRWLLYLRCLNAIVYLFAWKVSIFVQHAQRNKGILCMYSTEGRFWIARSSCNWRFGCRSFSFSALLDFWRVFLSWCLSDISFSISACIPLTHDNIVAFKLCQCISTGYTRVCHKKLFFQVLHIRISIRLRMVGTTC